MLLLMVPRKARAPRSPALITVAAEEFMPKTLFIVSLFPPAETEPVSVAEPSFDSMRSVVETMSPLTVLPSSTLTSVPLTRMLRLISPTFSPLVTFVAEIKPPTALFTVAELTELNETLPFALDCHQNGV